jgi:membrane-associated phospholipid phosphatase
MLLLNSILLNIIDWFKKLDTYLFLKINTQFTNPFLDFVYPWYRDSITWVPFYVFMLAFMAINFGKRTWHWLWFAVLTILVSDQTSSTLVKGFFARPRPCRDEILQFQVRLLLDGCSGGYSFTSSHATNHFAIAMFFSQTLKPFIGKWHQLFFVWAATIAYGQVYVGVHYPFDIICGGLLGCVIGYLVALLFNRNVGGLQLRSQIPSL